MRNFTFLKLRILILLGVLFSSLAVMAQDAVPFAPRLPNGNMRVKGDVMFVANHILNKQPTPNIANNANGNNNDVLMEYINIDNGATPGIFSSSSADLKWPAQNTCYRVAWAGLYWASIYPFERSDNTANFTPGTNPGDNVRHTDFNQAKLKLPLAANYTDVTADQVIFDGYGYYPGAGTALSRSFKDCPVVCFKNVTSILQGLPDAQGTYTMANIRAAKGKRNGGCSAGWVLVVIYENFASTTTSKFISVFDGYSGVGGTGSAPININGFQTLPPGNPVVARLGIAALEGDKGTKGDGLGIKANSTAGNTFTALSTPNYNPVDNFFNSTITNYDVMNTDRNPASTNTLGFDADMFIIPNPTRSGPPTVQNSVIPNNETGAQLKLTTDGDGYGAFLVTFAVDVIEPKMQITKTVKNLGGQDIAGQNVMLSDELYYDITFKNVGNDNAQNFTIKDILPINTSFVEVVSKPTWVSLTTPTPGTLLFTINDNTKIVKDGTGGTHTIRIKVKVASTCNELVDHCSNIIRNTAYGTYSGVQNTTIISDDPSVSSLACNAVPGPVNFLVNVSNCEYKRTEILCNPTLTLTAGAGYPSYAWFKKDPAGDIPLGNTQSITVSAPGEYYVINTPTAPCIGITEYITVNLSNNLPPNPLIAAANETAVCANNGIVMSNIFLCGINATKQMSAGSIAGTARWYKLDQTACTTTVPQNCPHNTCPASSWILQQTGTNYTVGNAGEYRLVIDNNGCQAVYYFNVYKNNLDPQREIKDMLCGQNGEIRVVNVGSGYEYRFLNQATGAVVQNWSTNPVYVVTVPGTYRAELRQTTVTDGCTFAIGNIGIVQSTLGVLVTTTDKTCDPSKPSSIMIEPQGVSLVAPPQQYKYELTGAATLSSGWIATNDPYAFNNLIGGTYNIKVTTSGGCEFLTTATINDYSNPQAVASVQQSISCDPGVIKIVASGGKAPYSFAVYSKDGVLVPPASYAYFSDGLYNVSAADSGTYVFIVQDANGCTVQSNPITINVIIPTVTSSKVDATCSGINNGSITISATGTGITYELLNSSATVIATNSNGFFGNLAPGTYTVNVIQTATTTVCRYPYTFVIGQPNPIMVPAPTKDQDLTCIATATITSGTPTGGTPAYQYSINGTTFQASPTFTGLGAGTYKITVKDANGCTGVSSTITITAPAAVTNINFSVSGPVTCNNTTVTVTAVAVGGQSPFTYEITAPASAVASNTTGSFPGLAPGTYTFKATDSKGCSFTKTYTIANGVKISVTASKVSDVKCFGASDGSLTFTPANYAPSYNYTVTGPTTVPAGNNITSGAAVVINNLAAGTYTVTVTSPSTGCTDTKTVVIAGPPSALAATPNVTQATCNTPGSVTIAPTGGWGGYTYAITLPATAAASNTTGTFNNLAAGNYTVVITDSKGCAITRTFTMTSAVAPELNLSAGGDYCIDATPTSVTVTITTATGMAPFQYKLDNGSYGAPTASTTATFSPLGTGTHTITVKDANGCEDSVTTTVSIAPQLTATATLVKGLDCNTPTSAQIKVTVGGGTLNYQYEVSTDGGTTYGALTALTPANGTVINYSTATAGTYKFRIADATGCTVETTTITVAPKVTPVITSVTQTAPVLCPGAATAAIDVVVNTATTTGYTLSVINTTTGENFGTNTSSLTPGTYNITIRDNKTNCVSAITNIPIDDAIPITYNYTKKDIECINNPGTVSFGEIVVGTGGGVTGGTLPYTYKVSSSGNLLPLYVSNDGSPHTFTVVDYGIYKIEVTDANGCTVTTTGITIASPPDDLDIDITTTATCTNGSATVEVEAAVGSGTYEFAILTSGTAPYVNNISEYKGPDNPAVPAVATFSNLIPGVLYTFVVHDTTTGCYFFKPADGPVPTSSNLTTAAIIPSNVTCTGAEDGNVSFTFTGYDASTTQVKYEIFRYPNVVSTGITGTVPADSSGTTTVSTLNLPTGDPGLSPGTYIIVYTELGGNPSVNGCMSASDEFPIVESAQLLAVTAVETKKANCNPQSGVVTATATAGAGGYEYVILPSTDPAPTLSTWTTATPNTNGILFTDAGNMVVYVKDAYGCIKSVAIPVGTFTSPEITATVDDACADEGTYSINVARIAGDAAPYSYSINDGATSSTFEFNADTFSYDDLASGTYTVTVMDINGCTDTAPPVQIFAPLGGTAEPEDQPTCVDNDGSIKAVPTGGSGNFEYELSGDATVATRPGDTFTGLSHGDFIVTIHDTTTGCTEQIAVSLEQPIIINPATTTAVATHVSCYDGNNGTVKVTLGAGNTDIPYEYTLTGTLADATPFASVTQTSPLFEGLKAGTYSVTVESGKGCTLPITGIIVDQPTELLASASATPFECDADNDVTVSTITVTATDGTSPYFYSIDGGTNYQSEDTFEVADTGSAQTITIDVKDDHGCTTQAKLTLQPLPVMTAPTADLTTPLDCANAGTITVEIDGGSGDYTFEMLPSGPSFTPGLGALNQTQDFPITEPGTYTFMVTDNVTHCTRTVTADEILEYQLIEAEAIASTQVDCFGSTTGTITIEVDGYTGPYNYEVFNGTTSVTTGASDTSANPLTISNMPAGNLFVRVEAVNTPFCSTDTNIITVASPADALAVTLTQTASVTCTNDLGEIFAEAEGGWGDYEYEFVDNATNTTIQAFDANNIISGLAQGTYTVTVRDSGGCTTTTTLTLDTVDPIDADITQTDTDVLCHGDQSVNIEATNMTGGQGTYEFALNTYEDATGAVITDTTGAQVSPLFENLGAGTYSITVTDNWSCTFTTDLVTVTEPDQLSASLNVTTTLTCTNPGAVVTITATGGTPPYSYSTDDVTYNGTNSFTVQVGTHHYYVKDVNNCASVITNDVTIDPIPTLVLDAELNAEISCTGSANAEIKADAIGGLGNYMYQLLDGSNNPIGVAQASGIFQNLDAGTYYVRVDSEDCNETSDAIVITDPDPMVVDSTVTPILCFGNTNGKIEVTATGGTGTIQYAISPNLSQFTTNGTFENLAPGPYQVLVQDANGCYEVLDLIVTYPDPVSADIINVTDETCLGEGDATIQINVEGGTGAYEYSIDFDPDTGIGTWISIPYVPYLIEDLVPGTTVINVRDANGCFLDPAIEQPILPGVNMDPQVDVATTCVNNAPNNDVTITIEADVDPANVTYSLDNATWQPSNVFTNVSLAPGNYIAYARHIFPATGLTCIQEEPFTIDVHDAITANITDVVNVLCHADLTGEITVTATGGTGTLQYAIADADVLPLVYGTPQTTGVFSDLAAGNYSIIITDDISCEVVLTQTITEPAAALAATATHTDEICINANDGTITVTPADGTGPYEVSINGGVFTAPDAGPFDFTALAPGTYTIEVRDANGCTFTAPDQTIAPGVDLMASIGAVQVCDETTITVTVNPAETANVTYYLDGALQSSNIIVANSLTPGNHTITVTHTNTCSASFNFTVAPVIPIVAGGTSQTDVLCFGEATGTATVTVTGGTGTLEYAIADANALPLVYSTYQASNTFTGLAQGDYIINAKDELGCELTSITITVGQPAAALAATATQTDEICINANDGTITVTPTDGTAPYEVSLNGAAFTAPAAGPFDFINLADGTYTIDVRDANGCTVTAPAQTIAPGVDLMASIDAVQICDETTITVTVNPAEAANVTYYLDGALQLSNIIVANGLTPGTHTIIVTHTNTCSSAPLDFNVAPVIPIVAAGTSETDVLCFGDATGTAAVTVTGGTGTLEYAIADSNVLPLVYSAYQTSNTFTGLAFGDYIINVKDELGCELASTTITVGQPAAALTATAAHTDEICINANDGTITVTPTDGTGPYEVSINGGGFTAPAPAPIVISNLADGTYTIEVRDANGCTFTAPDQTIAPGVDLMASIDAVQVCDETTITVTVNPAEAANVTYYLDGVLQPSNVIVANGLTPTTHNITVVHANTCSSPQLPFTVAPVIPIVAAGTSQTDVLCFGDATGTAAVTVTGGTGNLEYAIADANVLPLVYSAYQTSNTFAGLVGGDYIINVKDELGCELASTTITVGQPAAALAATATHTDEICINANDGTITVTPTDGTAPYRARINGGAYSAASSAPIVFNTLADGTYTVEVIDANGCTFTAPSQTIAPGFDLMASINVAQVCDTATITVSVNPTVASSVTYYLDGALQSSNVIVATGLTPSPAQHEIRVLHSNGCESLLNFEVDPIIPIVVSAATITVTPVACHGQNSGSIQVGATGGTGQLQYALTWNIWPTPIYGPVNTFNNLLAGNYTVWVKDAMGCVVSVTDVIIDEPAVALSATATSTPEVCVNSHNGTIAITPAGGTAPYSTAINSPINFQQDVFTYSGLFGGTYDVFVRDARGCYFKTTVVVEKGVNLNPYIQTTLSCNNNVPVNTVTVLLNPVVQNVEYRIPGVQDTFAANNTFDLLPGTYTVTVRHQNGCEKALTFTVQPRPAIVPTATAVDAKCNGEANGSITASATGGTGALKYGISPDYVMGTNPVFNNLAAGTYTIRVEDAYGCYEEVQATVGQPDAIIITVEEVLEEVCVNDDNGAIEISITGGSAPYATSLDANGPFVNDQLLFANLDGGVTYTIYVRDAKGCITTLDVPLAAPLDINATANVVYHCDSDTVFNEVTITTTGGINTSDLTYTLEGPAGTQAPQASNVFTNLEDGAYTVEVLHTSGCSDTVDFTIESVPALALSLSPSGLNRFTATVTGGKGPYTYALNDGDMGTKNTFTYEASGTYTVTVRDSRGCELTVAIDVIFIDIIIPDVVSPEGNGNNDTWAPGNTQNYPNINTDIFDRYGRKLATLRQGQSWDCRYEGSEMPSGDYWYLIKLGDAEGREFVGHFVIYR